MKHQDYIEYQALKKRYPVIPVEGFQTLAQKLEEAELKLRVQESLYEMLLQQYKERQEFLEEANIAPHQFKQDEKYMEIFDDMLMSNATLPYYQKDVKELKRLMELEAFHERESELIECSNKIRGRIEPNFETKPFTTEQKSLFE
ncbi:MAG: hypothetical protein N4A74_21535 [Carboxylicivirga sp.]|jgi:hypothetical protein|nr:hypothetical protein [Carboxylicivirga sp.]